MKRKGLILITVLLGLMIAFNLTAAEEDRAEILIIDTGTILEATEVTTPAEIVKLLDQMDYGDQIAVNKISMEWLLDYGGENIFDLKNNNITEEVKEIISEDQGLEEIIELPEVKDLTEKIVEGLEKEELQL